MNPRQLLAAMLAFVLVAGCSTSWPRVTAVSDARFLASAAPASIDVLPIDLEVWTHPKVAVDAEQVRLQAESGILAVTSELLYRRGYALAAALDWHGQYVAANGETKVAYPPALLLATIDSLASYGSATEVVTNEMPTPYLPMRLGEPTGSEATLYVGGWGFVGRKQTSGSDILTGIAIGVLVIGVVVIFAALLDKGGDTVDKALGSAAKGAGHVGKITGSAGRAAIRAAARASSVMIDVARIGAEVTADAMTHAEFDATFDAFGRGETHLNLVSGRPEWSQAPDAKHDGGSALYLEMTLVDNQSGLVRWHAHQRFPADPRTRKDVARAVKAMLTSLPAR